MVVKRDEFLDEEYLWNKAKQGGGDVTTEGISITANGRYVAPSGKAYTPVVVNVTYPNANGVSF